MWSNLVRNRPGPFVKPHSPEASIQSFSLRRREVRRSEHLETVLISLEQLEQEVAARSLYTVTNF